MIYSFFLWPMLEFCGLLFRWLLEQLSTLLEFCVVCVNQSEQKAVRPSLAQCRCVRCPQCDSANTVARDQTYYCHFCN